MSRQDQLLNLVRSQLKTLEQSTDLTDDAERTLSDEIELVERIRSKLVVLLVKGTEHDEIDSICMLNRYGYPFQVVESGLFYWESGFLPTRKGRIYLRR